MMTPVRCDPFDRSALKRENAEERDSVLEQLGHPQASMRKQAVIAKRHADTGCQVSKDRCSDDAVPRKERWNECEQSNEMDNQESKAGS
jgi:hypothetical protein